MTALSDYQRLEAPGTWRPAPGAQRREVIVSVGEATLVLTNQSDRPLAHWSLAALERRNPDKTPAIYAPGPDATEDLEIADADMIVAIERVRGAVERARPHPGKLRGRLILAFVVVVAVIGLIWVPDALVRHAARIAPDAARAEIGARLVSEITRLTGDACTSPEGDRALARLRTRLLGEKATGIVVLPSGVTGALYLPSGLVRLDRRLVEDFETPEVAAGYILTERVRAASHPPLLRLLDSAGLGAAVDLLTTGDLSDSAIRRYAEFFLTARQPPVSEAALLEAFRAADVRTTPYAYARDISGEETVTLIEADPVRPGAGAPILSDGDWVALQGICGG